MLVGLSFNTETVEAKLGASLTTYCTGDDTNKCRSSISGKSCYSFGSGSRCTATKSQAIQ